jgi:hypothetical protein
MKICLLKRKWFPKNKINILVIFPSQKGHIMCLICDKKKILDLLKGSISLAEVGQCYGKNVSSIHSTVLNSRHPEDWWTFFGRGLLGTIRQGSNIIGFSNTDVLQGIMSIHSNKLMISTKNSK